MVSTSTKVSLPVTNLDAGTYTVHGHYYWYSDDERYGFDYGNMYVRGPLMTTSLTFNSAPTPTTTTTTAPPPATTTTTLTGTPNPAGQGAMVTLTSHTTAGGSPVTSGTVTFSYGGMTLCSGVPVSSGVATCKTTALPIGSDTVVASYSGVSTKYRASSGQTIVTVGTPPPPGRYPT